LEGLPEVHKAAMSGDRLDTTRSEATEIGFNRVDGQQFTMRQNQHQSAHWAFTRVGSCRFYREPASQVMAARANQRAQAGC
jgi:hypothetical protein